MTPNDLSWTETASELQGPAFNRFQTELAKYNGSATPACVTGGILGARSSMITQK